MTTYSTGETIQSGDIVRVGKGKAEWQIMGIPGSPTRDGVTTGYHVSGPRRNMFIPAEEHARLSLIRAWVPCGAAYSKHTHAFTCTLAPSDHTAHEDHKTDAPAVVCWEESPTDIPAAYDPNTDGLPDPDNAREVAAWLAFTPTEESARAADIAMSEAFAEFDAKLTPWERELVALAPFLPEVTDGPTPDDVPADDDVERCPVCGEPSDYCQGHGEVGDNRGWLNMIAHDHGDHVQCDPRGCEAAGTTEHADYPHHVGYLDSCFACTSGACVCCESDSLAPCVSDDCEAREFDDEPDTEAIEREHAYTSGALDDDEPCAGESRPSFGGVLAVVVALALWFFAGAFGVSTPAAVASPVSDVAEVTEDSDAWNCATMGDHECGPRAAVPTVPGHCFPLPGRPGNTVWVMLAPVAGLVAGCEA